MALPHRSEGQVIQVAWRYKSKERQHEGILKHHGPWQRVWNMAFFGGWRRLRRIENASFHIMSRSSTVGSIRSILFWCYKGLYQGYNIGIIDGTPTVRSWDSIMIDSSRSCDCRICRWSRQLKGWLINHLRAHHQKKTIEMIFGGSWNRGTPKSSTFIGFSIIHPPFASIFGVTRFLETIPQNQKRNAYFFQPGLKLGCIANMWITSDPIIQCRWKWNLLETTNVRMFDYINALDNDYIFWIATLS